MPSGIHPSRARPHKATAMKTTYRQPSLLAPVDILQEQHQGEFVQHQRHPDAQKRGGGGRPARVGILHGQAADPAGTHENDPEDGVVEVHPAGRDVARPPPHLGTDHPDAEPDKQECRNKGHKEAEQPKSATGHDCVLKPATHRPLMQGTSGDVRGDGAE